MYTRLFLPIGFLLIGCAPQVPLQHSPVHPETVTMAASPDATIHLEHLGTQFNHLVFEATITNHTPDSVWFFPQHVSYYASRKMFSTPARAADIHPASWTNSRLASKRIFAAAPDRVSKLARQHAVGLQVLSGVAILVSAAVVVHDAVQDNRDIRKETWTASDAHRAVARDAAVDASLLLADASVYASANASAERYYLEEDILPVIQLPPGGTVSGKIFLLHETPYRYTRVVVPFHGVEYVFDFKRKQAPGTSKPGS